MGGWDKEEVMNLGVYVGAMIGFVLAIIFVATSIFNNASQVPPPSGAIAIVFIFLGGAIGYGISNKK